MRINIGAAKTYLFLKWLILISASLLVGLELLLGVINSTYFLYTFSCLLASAFFTLPLFFAFKKEKLFPFLAVLSFFIDLILVILALYLNGNVENTWLFFPVFIIFLSGYLFSLTISMAFAALSFLGILGVYLLEYFKVIPHFPAYGYPDFLWQYPHYAQDYLIGMFLLYLVGGFASGYLNAAMRRKNEDLEKSLLLSNAAQKDTETGRRALMNVMEDLRRAKDELEIRVKERTAELEQIKENLEKRVAERTADLEGSRKAVLHMLQDLKENVEKLKSVDRMKTEFLSMVSHELRTPLTPIKGYISLILSGKLGALTDEERPALEVVLKQSAHLATLIDSLVDLSRFELGKTLPPRKEPLAIRSVIEEVVSAMEIQANNKNIKVYSRLTDPLPTIMGDKAKIERALTNVFGNAIKFTPYGGEITIQAQTEGNNVRIEFTDNGIGIAKENLNRVFEKFFQVDSSYTRAAAGMGMGLPLAKEFIESHGGKMWIDSKGLGKEVTVSFTLPII